MRFRKGGELTRLTGSKLIRKGDRMKKSLIAAAVAGLFAAPAAMADVTISGAINLGIELVKSSSVPGVDSISRNQLNSNYSNINIASTDDIGNGNKVVLNLQLQWNPQDPTPSSNPFNRNSYLGIAGTWGAFKMGTNENVYERHMYQADPLDGALGPGGNLMILGTPGAGVAFEVGQGVCLTTGCVGFYRRSEHTIWYESPNMGGLTFEVDYTLSAYKGVANNNLTSTDPKLLSAGVKWQPAGMPFYIDAAIERHDDMFGTAVLNTGLTTATGSSDDAMQIGGGFSFGDVGLHARYEKLSYETDGTAVGDTSKVERDAMWIAVKFNLPSGYVGAELGIADEWDATVTGVGSGTVADTGAKMFGIGYFHNLSKQSQLQFIYARTDNDNNGTYTQAAAPLGGVPGSDHQVLHVGIKHTF
jgi:predicted porin